MKSIGYLRGALDERRAQDRAVRAHAARSGLALAAVHEDHPLPGGHTTLAGFCSVLDAAGRVTTLVVGAPDLFDEAQARALEEAGIHVTVASPLAPGERVPDLAPPAPPPPPRPKVPHPDAAEVCRRLFRGRKRGAAAGWHQSGPCPFGYRRGVVRECRDGRVRRRAVLLVEPGEAEIVRRVFRLYLERRSSMYRVCRVLAEEGVRTRKGNEWSRAGISWVLTNRTYLGEVHFGDVRRRGHHEAIVAPIQFNKAAVLMRQRDKRNRVAVEA